MPEGKHVYYKLDGKVYQTHAQPREPITKLKLKTSKDFSYGLVKTIKNRNSKHLKKSW